jgi:flavin reductase
MISSVQFRDGMARFVEAVTIVATDGPAGRAGLTATAVAPVTDAPPTLLVCANRSGRSHELIRANGAFSVCLLGAGQREVARAFASAAGRRADRFEGTAWTRLVTGAPVLAGAPVAFDCRLSDAKDVGTHAVFFGEVVAVAHGPEQPVLLYGGRDWRALDLSVADLFKAAE